MKNSEQNDESLDRWLEEGGATFEGAPQVNENGSFLPHSDDYEIGYATGLYEAQMSAIRAFEMGESELWAEHHRPKSLEDWDAWHEELESRGIDNIEARWKS